QTRTEGVDANILWRELKRQRFREPDHSGPSRNRQPKISYWLDGRKGRNVEDAASTAARHHGCHAAHHADDAHHVLFERATPAQVVEAERLSEWRCTVVVDQN